MAEMGQLDPLQPACRWLERTCAGLWCCGRNALEYPRIPQAQRSNALRPKLKRQTPPGGKTEPILEPKHTRALNSPRAIRQEMCRVYRAAINGHVTPGEGTRLIFMLREINAALAAEPQSLPMGSYVHTVNVVGIPSGVFLPKDEIEESLSQFDPAPLEDFPPSRSMPMLKVITDDSDPESEPPKAA